MSSARTDVLSLDRCAQPGPMCSAWTGGLSLDRRAQPGLASSVKAPGYNEADLLAEIGFESVVL